MTAAKNLDLENSLKLYPLAELITEIGLAGLDGSLRLSKDGHKIVIYFEEGNLVYTSANARKFRLFDILLQQQKIDKKTLGQHKNFANDLELAVSLRQAGLFSKEEIDSLIFSQIEGILIEAVGWTDGNWIFTPLARLRGDIRYMIDSKKLLIEYARCLPSAMVMPRFKSLQETFSLNHEPNLELTLQPHEAFILSRFDFVPLKIEEIMSLSGLSESETLRTLYTLWIAGLLVRSGWNSAFSPRKIESIRSARIELKKEAEHILLYPEITKESEEMPVVEPELPAAEPEELISLEAYLDRLENASTFYEVLDVDAKADPSRIKKSYFALAKAFHPDRFHKEQPLKLRRIQVAFAGLAQAYETLKHKQSRDAYDFKMRKELADDEKRRAAGITDDQSGYVMQTAAENFDQGFSLLRDNDYESAMPFLARAVRFLPDNARYHAYYGKALSVDERMRHKAEGELQTAVKLEPGNPTFRIMLVEFFIRINLLKRAEGELNRILSTFPGNKEAMALLDSLEAK